MLIRLYGLQKESIINYYEHHLGDYAEATAHLSFIEDAAYSRLMRKVYATELPLPADIKSVQRLVGARSKDERDAVAIVLEEFFVLEADGWHNDRCDIEISKYQKKALHNREVGKLGGRPRKTETQPVISEEPTNNPVGLFSEPKHNPPQTPDTSNQTPNSREAKASSSAAKLPTCPTQEIIDLYHDILPNLPKVRLHTKDRVKAIRKVWEWVLTSSKPDKTRRAETADQAIAWLRNYFEHATANDFLMGRTPRSGEHANWQCDIDFLMTDRGMKQVIEKTQTGNTP